MLGLSCRVTTSVPVRPVKHVQGGDALLFHANVQGLSTAVDSLSLLFDRLNPAVVCLSEHWLNKINIDLYHFNNMQLVSWFCRDLHIHGGVSCFVREDIACKPLSLQQYCTEMIAEFCGVLIPELRSVVVAVYRPCNGDFKLFLSGLDDVLRSCVCPDNYVYLLGDFNCEFRFSSRERDDLLLLLSSYGLRHTINEPTRIAVGHESCIDNIVVPGSVGGLRAEVLHTVVVSDHSCQHMRVSNSAGSGGSRYRSTIGRPITERGLARMRGELSETDWGWFELAGSDVQDCAAFLCDFCSFIADREFPQKRVNMKVGQPVNWFSGELRRMRDIIMAINNIYCVTGDPECKAVLGALRRDYRRGIANAKRSAFNRYLVNSKNYARDAWRVVNSVRGRSAVSLPGGFAPDVINDYFIAVPDDLVQDLPAPARDFRYYMDAVPPVHASCFLKPVTPEELLDVIGGLSNSTSFDCYNLNSRIVKSVADVVQRPLLTLFNRCLVEGIFPDAFKLSRVVAVFKRGDSSQLDSYRPISIVPIFGKILEILINSRLQRFFDSFGVINEGQYGFRNSRSAVQAVRAVLQNIVNAFEAGEVVSASLMDLSRAFDCVDHSILLAKLGHFGIRGVPLNLLSSYLTGRCQYVCVDGVRSVPGGVRRGVPQGSVLGPLLFILYTTDFGSRASGRCILYADDTTLLDTAPDYPTLTATVEDSVRGASDWFTANGLRANPGKTQTIRFQTRGSHGESIKLLGIVIDDILSWRPHIAYISGKLASVIYLLRSLRCCLHRDVLVMTYHALFGSRIIYGVAFWGGSVDALVVFRLQKWAIRTIAGVDRRTHCRPLFVKFKVLTLPCLYILHSLLEVHRVEGTFTRQSEVHEYGTRSSHLIRTRRFRLTRSTKNSPNLGLYNALPAELKRLPYRAFSVKLKRFLLVEAFYSVVDFRESLSTAAGINYFVGP